MNRSQTFVKHLINNLHKQIVYNNKSYQYEHLPAMKKLKKDGSINAKAIIWQPLIIQEDLLLGHKLSLLSDTLYKQISKTSKNFCQFNLNNQYKKEIKDLKNLK